MDVPILSLLPSSGFKTTSFQPVGGGSTLTLSGNNQFQGFLITPRDEIGTTLNVLIDNITFSECRCSGGTGGGNVLQPGGGGLGAGGALFIDDNVTVTLTNTTFTGCSAVGGNGGAASGASFGGGGGGFGGGASGNASSGGGGGGGGLRSPGGQGSAGGGGGGGGNINGFLSSVVTGGAGSSSGGGGGGGGTNSAGADASGTSGGNGGAGLLGGAVGTGGADNQSGGNGLQDSGGGGSGNNGSGGPYPGGDGGPNGGGGGGGGATSSSSTGGAGSGGNGQRFGGGGGGGQGSGTGVSGSGGTGGLFGGGGAAGRTTGSGATHADGGAGGFGGGGGGSGGAAGGAGGFGGGGGGGSVTPGSGGDYGGDGATDGGGGGAGLGGAIFVNTGGTLIFGSGCSFSGDNTATGGTGTGSAGSGQGVGADLFLSEGKVSVKTGSSVSIPAENIGIGYGQNFTLGDGTSTRRGTLVLTGSNPMKYDASTPFSGNISLNGALSVNSVESFGTGRISLSDNSGLFIDIASGTATFTNWLSSVSRQASFKKMGAGTLIFNPTVGQLICSVTVEEGTLTMEKSGGFSSQTSLEIQGGATLISSQSQGVGSLTGSGTLNIPLGIFFGVGNTSGSDIFSGTLEGVGRFSKSFGGTFILSGDNTAFEGSITLQSGGILQSGSPTGLPPVPYFLQIGSTLNVQHNSTIGSLRATDDTPSEVVIAGTVTLISNTNEDTTFDGLLTGSGTFQKSGSGILTLTGTSTISGGFIFEGGTVSIAKPSSLGIVDPLTFTGGTLQVTDTMTLSQSLSGSSGTLTKAGDSGTTLTLTGDNSAFSSTFVISSGSIAVANATQLGSASVNVAGGNLTLTGAGILSDNPISGTGTLTKTGADTTIALSGANTFTGATDITGTGGGIEVRHTGALSTSSGVSIGDGSILIMNADGASIQAPSGSGTIVATQNFTVNGASASTFSGNITGDVGVTISKTGSGKLTLTGAPEFEGTIAVSGGELALIGGTLTATVNATAGVVSGTGIFGDLLLSDSATCKPGASIGTLTVAGNYTLNSGATLEIEIDGVGASDLVDISGSATIGSDTTLTIVPIAPGPYTDGTTYTFLSADGGISGRFSTITLTDDTYFDEYYTVVNGNDYNLVLGMQNGGPAVQTQIQVTDLMGDMSYRVSNIQMRNLIALNNARWYGSSRCNASYDDKKGYEIYGIESVAKGTYKPYGNTEQYPGGRYLLSGMTLGGGYVFSAYDAVGITAGYTYGKIKEYPNQETTIHSKSFSMGVRGQMQPFAYIGLDLANNTDFSRYSMNTCACRGRMVEGETHGISNSLQTRLRGDFCFKRVKIQPYVGAYWTYLKIDAFDEEGGAFDAYHIPNEETNLFYADIGLCLSTNIVLSKVGTLIPYFEIEQYLSLYDKGQELQAERHDGNRNFLIEIPPYENNLFQIGAGMMYRARFGLSAYLMWNAILGNGQKDSWEGSFGMGYTF